MRGIDCAHRKILKIFSGRQKMEKNCVKIRGYKFYPQQRGKNFQNFSMRAIDFSHKITPKGSLVKKIFYSILLYGPRKSERLPNLRPKNLQIAILCAI